MPQMSVLGEPGPVERQDPSLTLASKALCRPGPCNRETQRHLLLRLRLESNCRWYRPSHMVRPVSSDSVDYGECERGLRQRTGI